MADYPQPEAKPIIRYSDERFTRKYARVTRRLELVSEKDMEEELSDGVSNGELHDDQLLVAYQIAAALQGGASRKGYVIE